jgi:alpha-1,2-mannosyltransferase
MRRSYALLWLPCVVVVAWLVAPRHPLDLSVYLSGARALLDGADVTAAHPADSLLPFTYPPFAAVLFAPLLGLSGLRTASLVMTALSVASLVVAVRSSLRSVRPGWPAWRVEVITAAAAGAALAVEPVRHTLDLGQVNLMLLALVLVDVLAAPERRWRGALTGLAAGVKLTPAIFVAYLLVTRQWRAARTAAAVGLGTVALGLLLAPASTVKFWTKLIFDPGHVGGIAYAGNQSLYGVAARLGRGPDALHLVWLVAVGASVVLGLAGAWWAERAGHRLGAVSLVGLTGLLVSPISWSHHWVWLIPGVIALVAVRWWLPALALLPVFVAAPIWWVPRGGNREYDWHGRQLLEGNAYALVGVVILLVAAVPALRVLLLQRRDQRLGEVGREVVADQQLILRLIPTEPDRGSA